LTFGLAANQCVVGLRVDLGRSDARVPEDGLERRQAAAVPDPVEGSGLEVWYGPGSMAPDTIYVALPGVETHATEVVPALLVLANALLLPFLLAPISTFREVKAELIRFRFSAHDVELTGEEWIQQEARRAGEIDTLHHLFWKHQAAFKEYSSIRRAFFSVMLAPVAAIAYSLFGGFSPPHWTPNWGVLAPALLLVTEILALLIIGRTLAVPPRRLQSVPYLVMETDVNYHALIDHMRLNISFDFLTDRPHSKDPQRIRLHTDIRVFGYRFLYLAYDAKGKVYVLSYGPIEPGPSEVVFVRPPGESPFTEKYFGVSLGEMSLRLKEDAELYVRLYVFASPYAQEELTAPYSLGEQKFQGRQSTRIRAGGGGGYSNIRTIWTDPGVKFKASGTVMTSLSTTEETEPLIRNVIGVFSDRIMNSRRIVTEVDPDGGLIL